MDRSAAADPLGPTPGLPDARLSFDQHNAWIRGLREDFNARVSIASEEGEEEEAGRGWSFLEERAEVDTESIAWGRDELAAGAEFAGAFDRALDFDDFDGPPVYRSMGLMGDLPDDDDDDADSFGPTRILRRQSTAEVEAEWLCEMPPLVCRQNAFADDSCRVAGPW